jgi:hypothetical protein
LRLHCKLLVVCSACWRSYPCLFSLQGKEGKDGAAAGAAPLVKLDVVKEATHNEAAWASRLPGALLHLCTHWWTRILEARKGELGWTGGREGILLGLIKVFAFKVTRHVCSHQGKQKGTRHHLPSLFHVSAVLQYARSLLQTHELEDAFPFSMMCILICGGPLVECQSYCLGEFGTCSLQCCSKPLQNVGPD